MCAGSKETPSDGAICEGGAGVQAIPGGRSSVHPEDFPPPSFPPLSSEEQAGSDARIERTASRENNLAMNNLRFEIMLH